MALKFKVLKEFRDKNTNDLYEVGSEFITEDQERAKNATEKGLIGPEIVEKQEQKEDKTKKQKKQKEKVKKDEAGKG